MKLAPLVVSSSLSLLSACDTPGDRAGPATTSTATATADTSGDASSGRPDTGGTTDGDPEVTAVCDRWNADRRARDEGTWTGSVADCDPGDVLDPGRENTLRQVNLYRWLAGLPAVATDAAKNASAQACALIMHANDTIEHVVPSSWRCREPLGAQSAGLSNLATTPGVEALDLYMTDEGIQYFNNQIQQAIKMQQQMQQGATGQ